MSLKSAVAAIAPFPIKGCISPSASELTYAYA